MCSYLPLEHVFPLLPQAQIAGMTTAALAVLLSLPCSAGLAASAVEGTADAAECQTVKQEGGLKQEAVYDTDSSPESQIQDLLAARR